MANIKRTSCLMPFTLEFCTYSYMKMCDVLKPISMDVIVCMSQLFDLYFYAVYHFFSTQEVRNSVLY